MTCIPFDDGATCVPVAWRFACEPGSDNRRLCDCWGDRSRWLYLLRTVSQGGRRRLRWATMNRFRLLFAPEEDDAPPAQRSRRDWLADWVIFVIAIAGGGVALASSIQHGLHGTL